MGSVATAPAEHRSKAAPAFPAQESFFEKLAEDLRTGRDLQPRNLSGRSRLILGVMLGLLLEFVVAGIMALAVSFLRTV